MKSRSIVLTMFLLVIGASSALAQQGNSGDASNAQQNGENSQTKSGGQPGGATDRQ